MEAASLLLDEKGFERGVDEIDDPHIEPALQAFAWELGSGATTGCTYEAGLVALVAKAIELDRAQRDLVEAVAEALDDRDAHAAAALVRDTDPDDDLWNNYIGPMLDSIEDDYTRMAQKSES